MKTQKTMPLSDLLFSFLAAAIASLVFCLLKVAFDSAAAASGSAFRLHRSTASPVPRSMVKGNAKRKDLKVSFEGDAALARDQDPDAGSSAEVMLGLPEAAPQNDLLRRRVGGRKLSMVPEE
jgi:hypothetical protein